MSTDKPVRPVDRCWLERALSAEARSEHAAYWAMVNAVPYQSNPEIEWYDQVGAVAYTASEYGIPGAPEVPEAVQAWRRERLWG